MELEAKNGVPRRSFLWCKKWPERTPKFHELIAETRAKSRPIFTPGSRCARGAVGAECAGRKFEVKSAHFCAIVSRAAAGRAADTRLPNLKTFYTHQTRKF